MLDAYVKTMQNSPFDWFILSLGVMLFIIQVVWFAGALFSYNRIFNAKLPYCRKFFIDLTEIFPLLGILGTVVALSSTLLGFDASEVDVNSLVRDFAPALSSTISGLICAIINSIMSSVLGLLIEPNYKSD